MKPIPLIAGVLLIILVAAVIGGAKEVGQGWRYTLEKRADDRSAGSAEAVRHRTEMNKIDEAIAEGVAPQKEAFWQTIYISSAIGGAVFIVGVGVFVFISSRGVAKGLALKAMEVRPDKYGRYPLLPWVSDGKLHVFNPANESVTVIGEGEKLPSPEMLQKATAEELARILSGHPDYQDIDVSRLPVANIIDGAKALIGS